MKSNTLIASLFLTSLPAFAGSPAPSSVITTPEETSPWEIRTALYGWAQGLDGDIGVRGRTASVDIGFDDIVEDLDFAIMGAIEISRGRWGLMADINYAETSADNSFGPISTDVELDQFLGNFVVTWQALRTDSISLDAYAGARVNSIDLQLDVDTPGKDFHRSQSKTWTDPIIGGRFQAELSDKFFFRAVGDIGGFGVASDLTWQAMAGFGWRVIENGSLLAGYRGIGTDYQDGGFEYDLTASGPVLGFEYKF